MLKGQEERVREEARIAQELHSPFIVEIVDSFEENRKLYMVMEYFSKGTLQNVLDELMESGKQIGEEV
jgi:serine/threonine protein kinase